MRHAAIVVVVAVALLGGCTEGSRDSTTSSESPVTTSPVTTSPPTTTPVTTSPIGETTTTTVPVETTTTTTGISGDAAFVTPDEFGLAPPEAIEGSGGASGSGCSPGNPMRDGVWFGFVHDIYPAGVEIDIACFWFGEIAYGVGEADGEDVANDFYVQNANSLLRKVPIGEDPIVWTIAGDPTEGHSPIAFNEWPLDGFTYVECPGDYCGVWLYLNDGLITEIVEQYTP